MVKYAIFLVILLSISFSCSTSKPYEIDSPAPNPEQMNVSFLALGDSYTIGESVSEHMRWPMQLQQQFNANHEKQITAPTIIARTGWTTDELLSAIAQQNLEANYDLVSLLIGVNNQYRDYEISQFETEFSQLVEFAIEKAGSEENVFVVSIPDWGLMPFADGRDRDQIAQEIDEYNALKQQICSQYNVKFISITEISRAVSAHPEYIAEDGLHPSGEQYSTWINEILPIVSELLHD